MFLAGLDQIIFRGKAPWTLKHAEEDHLSLRKKKQKQKRFFILKQTVF